MTAIHNPNCLVLGCQFEEDVTADIVYLAKERAKQMDLEKGKPLGVWPYQWRQPTEDANIILFWSDFIHKPKLTGGVKFTPTDKRGIYKVHFFVVDRNRLSPFVPNDIANHPLYERLYEAWNFISSKTYGANLTVELDYAAVEALSDADEPPA